MTWEIGTSALDDRNGLEFQNWKKKWIFSLPWVIKRLAITAKPRSYKVVLTTKDEQQYLLLEIQANPVKML